MGGEHEPEEDDEPEGVCGVKLSAARPDAAPDFEGEEGGGDHDEEDEEGAPAVKEEGR